MGREVDSCCRFRLSPFGPLVVLLAITGAPWLAGCSAPGRASAAPARANAGANHVSFTDVTAQAGIRFRHVNGAAGQFHLPETMGSGCVFFDYDGDGWMDIFLVNSGPLPGSIGAGAAFSALYRNQRDGTFRDVTREAGLEDGIYGMGACAGDYDNDGYPDLYVTAALGSGRLFHNRGDGTFEDVTAAAGVGNAGHWGTSCAWLDYDNDGRLDLFVCNYVRYRLEQEKSCHQGALRTYCGPLVYDGESCRLYRNLGAEYSSGNGRRGWGWRFRDVSRIAGIAGKIGKSLGVAIWDFDGDRFPEIVVANDLTPNHLFRNNRDGTFREVGLEAGVAYGGDGTARSGMGIDVADTQNDGRCAILISNYAGEPNSFFSWRDSFSFSDRTYEVGMGEPSLPFLGFGLFFFDYDNDGWKDAFVANGHIQPEIARYEAPQTHAQRPLLFHNQRDGTFAEVGEQIGGALLEKGVGRGAAYGDYDNDGDLDILLANNNGPARLLRNDGGSRGTWLLIRLAGTKSNRDGLGAEVRVRLGNRILRDQARSGSSYLSGSDPRLHFGLGTSNRADTVEVRWPSGMVDRLSAVPANQVLTIVEGSTR